MNLTAVTVGAERARMPAVLLCGTAGKSAVFVVDDHPVVCKGLAELLNRQPDLVCCGAARTLAGARQAIPRLRPGLVVMDLQLGDANGLEAIRDFRRLFPDLRILVLSEVDETVFAEQALRAGAHGYVLKQQPTEEILRAVRSVLAGGIYVSRRIAAMTRRRARETKSSAASADLNWLTDRELEVLSAVKVANCNNIIAAKMHLGAKTIQTCSQHLKRELRLATGAEAAGYGGQRPRNTAPNLLPASNADSVPPRANLAVSHTAWWRTWWNCGLFW